MVAASCAARVASASAGVLEWRRRRARSLADRPERYPGELQMRLGDRDADDGDREEELRG